MAALRGATVATSTTGTSTGAFTVTWIFTRRERRGADEVSRRRGEQVNEEGESEGGRAHTATSPRSSTTGSSSDSLSMEALRDRERVVWPVASRCQFGYRRRGGFQSGGSLGAKT